MSRYEVIGEPINEQFEKKWIRYDNQEITSSYDAKITVAIFEDDGTKRIEEYGYISSEELVAKVSRGEKINIDWCCIERADFSKRTIESISACSALFFDVTFEEAQFSDEANFWGARFSGYANFQEAQFSDEANFWGARFSGYANFRKSRFSGNAYFVLAQLNGEANFRGTQFSGNATFSEAQFSGNAIFWKTQFSGYARFGTTQFSSETDFVATRFSDYADFAATKFSGETSFNATQFSGYADFETTQFSADANFGATKFSGETNFSETQFSGNAYFGTTQFSAYTRFIKVKSRAEVAFIATKFNGEAEIIEIEAKSLLLENCIVQNTLNLAGLRVKGLSVSGMKILSPIYVEWDRDELSKAIHGFKSKSETPNKDWARQFQLLKENFRSLGQYEDEDKAYVEFKQHEALAMRDGEGVNNRTHSQKWRDKMRWAFRWFIQDFIGGYGTKPLRILLALVGSIVVFGLIYMMLGQEIDGKMLQKFHTGFPFSDQIAWVVGIFYFSAITTFTVGYGDISASNIWTAIVSCFQAFTGVFLMSYFTVAFARKVLR